MTRTLIAFSTVDGHTLSVSRRLQQCLEALGHVVELVDLASAAEVQPAAFDRIVIGASIRYGKYREELFRFIETHRAVLEQKPSAFFSVNVVARKPGRDTPASNPYIRTFRRGTSWEPSELGVFAGKLDYRRYRFLDRQMIRLIMLLTKGPTDPSSCVEFTDWPAVERFAQRLASLPGAVGPARA